MKRRDINEVMNRQLNHIEGLHIDQIKELHQASDAVWDRTIAHAKSLAGSKKSSPPCWVFYDERGKPTMVSETMQDRAPFRRTGEWRLKVDG